MRAFNGHNDRRDTSLQWALAPSPECVNDGRFLPEFGPVESGGGGALFLDNAVFHGNR
jgi:hypothetical protein